jgi:patatin-related protein
MTVRPLALTDALRELPAEELRLALVLNGGVSLAVWMGGVALEIDRLTRAADTNDGYGAVLGAARTKASVDIISGTSAGGINGAALALCQANARANLRDLRDLWAEQGRMEVLLRSPFQGQPTSLLRGDDYFLPELKRALGMLADPFEARNSDPGSPPAIDLTLTTTLLTGSQEITVDDFGEPIPQRVHAGRFRFSTLDPDRDADLFSAGKIVDTAAAMALAARCTASFPFAFEPSFVPVGEEPAEDDELRVNMQPYASWRHESEPQSRYTVDGGVLANTPVTHALQAIERREVDGPVRRAMLLVFPHAPKAEKVKADKAAAPPGAVAGLAGVLGALQSQGSRSFVDRIDEHNRKAAEWRGGRSQLLKAFGDDGENAVEGVYRLLSTAWPHYRHIRIRVAAAGLAGRVQPRRQWPYERIRFAAEDAQRAWVKDRPLPYVPERFHWASPEWVAEHIHNPDVWWWGDTGARGVTEAIAAVLREALGVVTDETKTDRLSRARRRAGTAINTIAELRAEVDAPWLMAGLPGLLPNKKYWRARLIAYGLAMNYPATQAAQGELNDLPVSSARDSIMARAGETGKKVYREVRTTVGQLTVLRGDLTAIGNETEEISDVKVWCDYLFSGPVTVHHPETGQEISEPTDDTDRVLLRLLALDAATRLLAEGASSGSNQPIRLAELSLRVQHPWARLSRTPDDKAAGLELRRFGGFLKGSWRMNDWTWGRLDAVTMLCQLVLDPARLKRMAGMVGLDQTPDLAKAAFPDAVLAMFKEDLYGGATLQELSGIVDVRGLQARAREELRALIDAAFDPDKPDPLYLPNLARLAALPIQAEIILEELPVLANAIRVDVEDGAGTPTRGTRFLAAADAKGGILEKIADAAEATTTATERLKVGLHALAAFDAAGIGREPLADEVGSNSLIRTASKATGVLATVLDTAAGERLKPVTKSVRGAAMLPYWMVNGLAGGGTIARFLATAGLVVGGVLVALSLFGVLGGAGAAAGMLGAAALLAALAYSAVKTGSLLHAAALLAPVGPLVAYALSAGEAAKDAASRVLVILIAAAALYVLASIPWPLLSPLGLLSRLLDRLWWKTSGWLLRILKLTALGVLIGVVYVAGRAAWDQWNDGLSRAWESLRDSAAAVWLGDLDTEDWDNVPVAVAAVLVGAVVVGAVIAYWQGGLLRIWRPEPNQPTIYPVKSSWKRAKLTGAFVRDSVRQPDGVAASWAPVYGGVYLAAAVLLFHLTLPKPDGGGEPVPRDDWVVLSLWWLAVLGVLLCVVAPIVAAHPPRRRARALLRRAWKDLAAQTANPDNLDNRIPRKGNESQRLLYALLKYGVAYDYLVSPGFWNPFADAKRLRLSLRGLWLRWRVDWATKRD